MNRKIIISEKAHQKTEKFDEIQRLNEASKVKKEHAEMVTALAKPGQAIIDSLTPDKADLLHMAVGVAGEAGELLDAVKKHVIYVKDLDVENVVEELGDKEFYMERIRQLINVSRVHTLQINIMKLEKRYKYHQYDDQAAQARADKDD